MMILPVLLLTYLYFLQGLPYGLQARFLPIYFRANGMSLSNIGFIKVLFFPWMCKTLWAPLVDRHGNKKTWLSWSMLGLGVTCFLAAGIEPSWYFYLCVILLLFNFLTSTQDIATDGLAIEILTSSEVASGNIAQVVGYKFGAIIGGGLLAWLSEYISWSSIFLCLCSIYATAVVAVKLFVPHGTNHLTVRTVHVSEVSDLDSEKRKCKVYAEPRVGESGSERSACMDSHTFKTSNKYSLSEQSVNSTGFKTSSQREGFVNNKDGHSFDLHCDSNADSRSRCLINESSSDVQKKDDAMLGWIQDHFAAVFSAEGTKWILLYVLIYKLGESKIESQLLRIMLMCVCVCTYV